MTDFKAWHEDDGITFHCQSNVYFSQCAKNGLLSLNELLRLTSDVAVEEYRQRGISREVLLNNNFAILVSRVSFRLHRLPKENEHITLSTWEETPEALQLIRAYEIISESGEPLVSGLSSWLLVDPNARRIIPTKKFNLRPVVNISREHNCLKPGKIVVPDDMQKLSERVITYSDVDAYGHTNNSRYGAFIMDALPLEYSSKTFKDFRINYSKEALLGDTMEIYAKFEENKICVIGKTVNGNSFESELFF